MNLGVREVERRLNNWLFNLPFEQRVDAYLALRAALRVVAPDWVSAEPCRLHLPAFQPPAPDPLNCCL